MTKHDRGENPSRNILVIGIFFCLSFLYFWFELKPELIYQAQEPVFFSSQRFFNEFLNYPGGLIDYFSAFLTQFYIFPIIGALILSVILLVVVILTKLISDSIWANNSKIIFSFIPAILLFGLHHHYDYPLSYSLGFIAALLFFYFYLKFSRAALRFIIFPIFFITLYYIAAGSALFFGILSIIYELLNKENSWKIRLAGLITSGVVCLLVPYVSTNWLFLINAQNTYSYLLPFSVKTKIPYLPYILYGFFPLLLLGLLTLLNMKTSPKKAKKKKQTSPNTGKLNWNIVQPVLIVVLLVLISIFSFESKLKTFLIVKNEALQGNWEKILTQTGIQNFPQNRIITMLMNRALHKTGQLAEKMFAYPQNFGPDGLLYVGSEAVLHVMENSDIMLDLGYINSSQYWVYEALSVQGETPRILKRMAEIHLIKKEYQIAQKCLEKLKLTLFHQDWADKYMKMANNPEQYPPDASLLEIRSSLTKTDFYIRGGLPRIELASLVAENNYNRPALEYLIAYDLLNCRLDNCIENFQYLEKQKFPQIPKSWQEAFVLYWASRKQAPDPVPEGFNIGILNRFSEYMSILARFQNNKDAARKELTEKMGDTYWYYYMYTDKVEIKK